MAHSQFSDLWLTSCFFSDRRLGKIHLRGSEQRRVWAEEGEELCRLLRWALNTVPGLFSVFDQDVIFLFILGFDCFVTRADKSPKSWIYSLQWTPQNINVMTSSVIIFWWVRCLYKNSTMFVRSDVVLTFLHTHTHTHHQSVYITSADEPQEEVKLIDYIIMFDSIKTWRHNQTHQDCLDRLTWPEISC